MIIVAIQNYATARKKLYDACAALGQMHWYMFLETPRGMAMRLFAPSPEHMSNANLIFLSGFGCGLLDGIHSHDSEADTDEQLTEAWEVFLEESEGEVLLAGRPFPATPPAIYEEARRVFVHGYRSANAVTAAMNEE